MGNMILMKNPANGSIVEVSEKAFDVIWEKRGWTIVNPYEMKGERAAKENAVETPDDELSYPDDPEPVILTEPSTSPDHPTPDDPYPDLIDSESIPLPTLEDMDESDLRAVAADLGIENADDLTANELRSLIGNTPEFYA